MHDPRGRAAASALLDIFHEVRLDELAAVRKQRVEAGHLQRRDEEILLADRELDRVTRLPKAVDPPVARIGFCGERAMPPLRRREQPGRLRPHVDAGLAAEAELRRPGLERMACARRRAVEVVAHPVEPCVARRADRGRQRHRLGDERVDVVERVPGDAERAGAVEHGRRRDHVRLEGREGGHRLEGRTGRIQPVDRPVQRRIVVRLGGVRHQPLRGESLRRDEPGVDTRVVARVRGHREDRTVARLQRHDGAGIRRPLAVEARLVDPIEDRALGRPLQVDVECQPDRLAGHRRPLRQHLAVGPPERVDAQLLQPRPPAQVRVVSRFEPGLTDLVPGCVALAPERPQLLGRDLGDVADELCCERAVRIAPQVRVDDLHPGEVVFVLEEVVHERLALDRLADGHRRDDIVAPPLDPDEDLEQRDVHDLREASELEQADVPVRRQVGRPELHRGPGRGRDERMAGAVEDLAALRRKRN